MKQIFVIVPGVIMKLIIDVSQRIAEIVTKTSSLDDILLPPIQKSVSLLPDILSEKGNRMFFSMSGILLILFALKKNKTEKINADKEIKSNAKFEDQFDVSWLENSFSKDNNKIL